MSKRARLSWALMISICVTANTIAQPALACSVCYGDPNSSMTHGAQAGVLVLLGVIIGVLSLIAALLLFWMRRAASLQGECGEAEEASGA